MQSAITSLRAELQNIKQSRRKIIFQGCLFVTLYSSRNQKSCVFLSNKLIQYIICDPELRDVVWIIVHKFVLLVYLWVQKLKYMTGGGFQRHYTVNSFANTSQMIKMFKSINMYTIFALNPLAPEFPFKFQHTLYLKCE